MNTGKFRGKYRNESVRNPRWDYAGPGRYFITICTDGRMPWFGRIQNGMMELSDIGKIAHECWRTIPDHFDHVTIDAFIVMPDHMHGIIVIGEQSKMGVGTCDSHVPTEKSDRIARPPPGSVGSVIGQFKSACTKRVWQSGHPDFRWQPRFHDRIIRDDAALETIRRYIKDNPRHWQNG